MLDVAFMTVGVFVSFYTSKLTSGALFMKQVIPVSGLTTGVNATECIGHDQQYEPSRNTLNNYHDL